MTNPLATAAIEAGLVDQASLDEMRRWRPPVDLPEQAPVAPASLEEASQRIEQVLQSEGFVITRETDLEVLQQYLHTQQQGTLHVEILDLVEEEPRVADFEVTYGRTRVGEYIFAYRGESMAEEMTNGLSCLVNAEGEKIFFTNAREVFYGEVKAFMVCHKQARTLAAQMTETASV